MNRLKLFATATLMALAFTACDEGTPPPVEPPPPPTPVGTISGAVTIEGTAASGITATLSSGATTTTGSGGNFAFSGVEAGTYTVTISGFPEDATFAEVTQSATIATDGQNVQLTFAGEYIRSSAVVGNVVAADAMMSGGDGQPETLAGVTVTLGGEFAMGETMETDETGGFAFTGLRAGTYTVTISDFPEDVSFETVSVEIEVDVGDVGQADFTGHYIRTSAVEGQVIIEGEGLAGVTVTLSGGPADESYTSMTDADGMYRFDELRPGDYTVSIADFDPRDYEFAATSQDVSVDLDETGTVSFTGVLLRTSGISGRVSVEGMGLEGVAVTLSGAADDTTTTDAGGQYAFAGLAAGDYTVSIAVESAAYVFGSMSTDRTVGDDESAIVNFEGAHATTASVSGMLFIDELDNNDMHDEGEYPLAHAGIPVALVGPGVNDQRLSATGPDGSFMFSGLRAGSYQLVVPIDATVRAALAANDVEYGGPGTGYAFALDVGETKTQAVPFDITHTRVNFSVALKHGDDDGPALEGATVDLYSDAAGETKVGSGETGADGSAMIRVDRDDTSGNMVYAQVSAADYHVAAEGSQAVTWNPQSNMHAASNEADIVNLNVEVNVTGTTVETSRGGGVELGGWAIEVMSGDEAAEGAPEALGDDGTASFESQVEYADLPATFTFAVAEEQDDDLDNGEMIAAEAVPYEHDGLSLAGAQDVAIEASFATQTLMVYVYHEKDQVEGFTGTALGDDEMMSGVLDVEVRQAGSGTRTRAISSEDWDAAENTSDKDGVYTFAHLPSSLDVIVTANAAGENVIIHGSDQLATYEDFDDNGIPNTSSVFGELGGYHHTVELCPMQAGSGCGSFGFIRTYTVDGQAWKNVREMDSDDGFKSEDTVVKDAGITVSMTPVADKNLEGEAAEGEDELDFGSMADGAYSVGVPDDWMASAGMDGDELPEEFLLATTLTGDDHLNIDVTPTTGFLYGIVENQDGVPAEGVTVSVNGVDASDPTDEFGRYVVEGFSKQKSPKAAIEVKLSGAGYASKTYSSATESHKVPDFEANSPAEYDLTVTGSGSAATFTGTVTAAGGGALSGVEITVDGSDLLNPNAKSKGSSTDDIYKTGADGTYEVMVEANGADVTLSASMDGMSFQPGEYTQQARAGSFPGPNFTGFEYATILGRVTVDGKPQANVKVEAQGTREKPYSDVTNSAGAFSISVPYGSYTVTAVSAGYSYSYPGNVSTALTINLRPGEDYPFNIAAEIAEGGRPPRITTTSFSYEEKTGSKIGDMKAVDDDDDEATFTWAGSNNRLHVTGDGALRWVGSPPSHSKVAANNKYTLDVEVTSAGDDVGTSTTAEGEVTVTVTSSDNVVVTLKLDPASISEAGGTSTVTATLEDPAPSEFYVTVAVSDPSEVKLSSNKTLTIREGETSSSGPPVTITAINDDNAYNPGDEDDDYKRAVTVSGSMSPRITNMEVKSAKLLIEDDDLAYGKIALKLTPTSIDESGTGNVTTVTASLSTSGITFPRDVTITVTAVSDFGPDGVLGGGDDVTNATVSAANADLTIAAGARTSTGTVTITADDDDDVVNTVVTVRGTTAWDHDGDGTNAEIEVPEASQPASVYLTVTDDDVAPGMPADVTVSDVSTGGFEVSWETPSSLGTIDGTDGDATSNITYQVRYTPTSEANDPTTTDAEWDVQWGAQVSPHTVTGATLVENRSYTVQVRTVLTVGADVLNSSSVTRTFTVPSSS